MDPSMRVVSPAAPAAPTPLSVGELSGLPYDLKSDILERLDIRTLDTLLSDRRWQGTMRPARFDRLARTIVAQHQGKPLGSWPAPGEWTGLAREANALRDRSPQAGLL